ncbi:MAG TPA: GGDEF domain-containing protein [Polyangiaceae bacterium]|nr:GGDEF domain-containing protein [Polyangiaceae bacterium]
MSVPSSKRTAVVVPSERPSAAGRPMLVVIAGPELGRRIELTKGDVVIGREEADGVNLRIDSDQVSRKHATVQRIGRQAVVSDHDSTNGTFVNETKIKNHRLVEGDTIRIGKVVFKYTESALEAEYHERIQKLASVDGLTGAFNKRYFEETFSRLIAARNASSPPLSLLLFDIDHFKKINDTRGHAAGDAVLKQFAEAVRGQVREKDVFCRVGGEEFAVLLEGTNLGAAHGAAEFVRGAIEMTDFVFEGKRIPVTTSLGVAEHQPGESHEAFFKRADAKLYEAKHGGRNRVC